MASASSFGKGVCLGSLKPRGKSGSSMSFPIIISIVIFIAGFILLLSWINSIMSPIETELPKEICKRSVAMHSSLNLKGVNFNVDTIVCPTVNFTIEKGAPNQEINARISKAMFDCWDQFNEGKAELFDSDGIYCAICHIIAFEEDGRKVRGLAAYQRGNYAPGKQSSYSDYFQGYRSENSEWLYDELKMAYPSALDSIDAKELDTSKEYMTVFVYARGSQMIKRLLEETLKNPLSYVFIGGGIIAVSTGIGAAAASGAYSAILQSVSWSTAKIATGTGIAALAWEYFTNTKVNPDYMAFIAMREYSPESIDELSCEYLPAAQSGQQNGNN